MLTSLAFVFLVGLSMAAVCQKLRLPRIVGMLIAGIVRANGEPIIPSGNDVMLPGDDVVVVTTGARIKSLHDILQ